jgi:hypothetical protein
MPPVGVSTVDAFAGCRFLKKIFCNERILLKNLDTGKTMGMGTKRRFCGKNETESYKKARFFSGNFLAN